MLEGLKRLKTFFGETGVLGAWASPTAMDLKILVAVAKARNMQAEDRKLVTRERTTDSKFLVPLPSSYVRYQESILIIPDSVLQDYLKKDLTYSDYKELANTVATVSIQETPYESPTGTN